MIPRTIDVTYRRIHKFGRKPTKEDPLDVGYDFYVVADEDFMVHTETPKGCRASLRMPPGESHLFHLGIQAAIEPGYALFYWDRSGMGAKRNIHRFAGAIDSKYRGEWMVSLCNFSNEVQVIHEGDRIIQGVFAEVINATWDETDDELPESSRGEKGFGASGR